MAKQPTRSRGLNLGGGDTGRMKELLLIAALAIVIVGSLVVTVMYGWSSDDDKKQNTNGFMFKCTQCDAEFAYDPETVPRQEQMMRSSAVDCKKCKGTLCALPMTKCPQCEKYYLSEATRYQHKMEMEDMKGEKPSGRGAYPPAVCPHCKTDFHKWHRENRSRKSRR